jgi:hypothetical protein
MKIIYVLHPTFVIMVRILYFLTCFVMNLEFFSWSGVRDTWRTGNSKPCRLFWRRFHHLCLRFGSILLLHFSFFGLIHFTCVASSTANSIFLLRFSNHRSVGPGLGLRDEQILQVRLNFFILY